MSDLTPEERAFLDTARKEWGPADKSDRAIAAIAAIEARAAAEPDFGADAPSPNAGVAKAPSAGLFGRPWLVGAGLAAIGLCVLVVSRTTTTTTTNVESAPPATHAVAAPGTPSITPTPAIETSAPSPAAVSVDSLPNAAPTPTVAPARPSASAGDTDTLQQELALLRAAQTSLRAGAPAEALTTLATHASRFPHGVLREERMTLQVLALCDRGDVTAARALRDELVRSAPGSSHLQRLATSCAAVGQ